MKTGLTFSVVMHAGLIAFAVLTLSAPHPLDVADVEALPVDIVPVQSITQVQQGDKKAPVADKAAPAADRAAGLGEGSAQCRQQRGRPEDAADAARPSRSRWRRPPRRRRRPSRKPVAQAGHRRRRPSPSPSRCRRPRRRRWPSPSTRWRPIRWPRRSSPRARTAQAVKLARERAHAARPGRSRRRPRRPRRPERKDADKPAVHAAATPKPDKTDYNADQIAALLDKEAPSGGGAKRSDDQASLGARQTTSGQKLSQSEMDALAARSRAAGTCPPGVEAANDFKVDGSVQAEPQRQARRSTRRRADGSGNQQFDDSVVRAVQVCDQAGPSFCPPTNTRPGPTIDRPFRPERHVLGTVGSRRAKPPSRARGRG